MRRPTIKSGTFSSPGIPPPTPKLSSELYLVRTRVATGIYPCRGKARFLKVVYSHVGHVAAHGCIRIVLSTLLAHKTAYHLQRPLLRPDLVVWVSITNALPKLRPATRNESSERSGAPLHTQDHIVPQFYLGEITCSSRK